jgi:hypothetical protein
MLDCKEVPRPAFPRFKNRPLVSINNNPFNTEVNSKTLSRFKINTASYILAPPIPKVLGATPDKGPPERELPDRRV